MQKPGYRSDIDGLRALAVLAVVVFHAFPGWLPGGFIGVDVFFVISGFLITGILVGGLRSGEFSFAQFYARRIRRIFPALLVVLVACFVAGWFLLDTGDYALLGKHIAGGAGFVQNAVLWQESGYFDLDARYKPLLHLWSLAIEEQFYLLWPLALWAASRARVRVGALIGVLGLSSFAAGVWAVMHPSAAAYYSPAFRFWELMAGAGLAQLAPWRPAAGARARDAVAVIGIVALVVGAFAIREDSSFPGWLALVPVAGTAAIIHAGPGTAVSRLLSARPLVGIGLVSFPLYLWHWPIVSFWHLTRTERPPLAFGFAVLAASTVLAWLVWVAIERPVRTRGRRGAVAGLVASMVLVGFVGLNTSSREGYPFRAAHKEALQADIKDYLAPPPTYVECILRDGAPPAGCYTQARAAKAPVVLLWGDSHAANMSYGLTQDKLREFDINLLVTMRGACPPVVGFRSNRDAGCPSFVQKALDIVRQYRPDTVVLLAAWSMYSGPGEAGRLQDAQVVETVGLLRKMGVRNVVLVGSFPVFEVAQPRLARRVFVPGVRNRTADRLDPGVFEADRRIAAIARQQGAAFVSPMATLCDQDGCLVSASLQEYRPMAYDESHMTYPGAMYFVSHAITPDLLRAGPAAARP